MKLKEEGLGYITLGELIKECREKKGLSLTELSNLAGITKGGLSKIENGETKRPELTTIKSIANVLDIPYQEIIEHYIEVEQRPDALRELLLEVIHFSDKSLITKVALKVLQSPQEDTYTSLEKLYGFAEGLIDPQVRIILYNNIVKYSRDHGVMSYLAKGLLQKYLIERDDFSRLHETYQSGKYTLHYIDFLSSKERTLFLYKLGVHAYNLMLYNECIELCEQVLVEEEAESRLRADAVGAICNAYFYLEQFDVVETYLDIYKGFSFPHIQDNVKLMTAALNSTRGFIDTAIKQLQECLEFSENTTIHVINRLFELHLKKNDLQSIEELLKNEPKLERQTFITPYQKSELAYFYKLKGDFIIKKGHFDDAIDCYIKSALEYGKVSAHAKSMDCLHLITDSYINNNKEMDILVLRKLQKLYNELR